MLKNFEQKALAETRTLITDNTIAKKLIMPKEIEVLLGRKTNAIQRTATIYDKAMIERISAMYIYHISPYEVYINFI